jgi:hypothetical protein
MRNLSAICRRHSRSKLDAGEARTTEVIARLFVTKASCWRADDIDTLFHVPQENVVLIQSVELVALPDAPAYQEKVYRAHLDSGADVDLFQAHWDVPLQPESLVGLSVQAARKLRNEKMLAVAQGHH